MRQGSTENLRSLASMYTINPHTVMTDTVVLAMVGLPARGKSYISKAIVRYLNFIGCPCKLFNAGEKRRDVGLAGTNSDFFNASNETAKAQREKLAMDTLEEMLAWLNGITGDRTDGCACGILDATNTTRERRQKVLLRCANTQPPVKVLFLESLCDDHEILKNNYLMKLDNADYKGRDPGVALADFLKRVQQYENVYEPVAKADFMIQQVEDDLDGNSCNTDLPCPIRYLKIVNAGRELITSNCDGYVLNKVLSLLHSIHLGPRTIWLTVVGETINDTKDLLGGDSSLSKAGMTYAEGVANEISVLERLANMLTASSSEPAMVLCGTLRRYAQMAEVLCQDSSRKVLKLNQLNDLCLGEMDSKTGSYLQLHHPRDFEARAADKLRYRYPGSGGESYLDVILRLQETILTLEQSRNNIIVVGDRAVCRALLAYFEGTDIETMPKKEVQPGIHELRRSHSGFAYMHVPVKVGAATNQAGPGTESKFQRKQTLNKLPGTSHCSSCFGKLWSAG